MVGLGIKTKIGQMCLAHAKDTVRGLGLTDIESTAILDMLDAERTLVKESTRRSVRLPIRGVATVVLDSGSSFLVRLRDSSRRDASFVCCTALEESESIRLDMPTLDGPVEWQATVVRCRCVDGLIHEIGVVFAGVF